MTQFKKRDSLEKIPASAYATLRARPIVAVVGRPNVGKSTLFNRLAGNRIAIVHDLPGVTRDRNYAEAAVNGIEYTLIDTGGFDPDSEDPMRQGIVRQIRVAIEEADVILCVFDATMEVTAADIETVRLLRESNRPVIYIANKADNPQIDTLAFEMYRLGIADIIPISAVHGRNIADLEEALEQQLPKTNEEEPFVDPFDGLHNVPRVALIGRPNAGKSSLLNRLLGYERMLVDSRPGTTRDTIDALVHYKIRQAKNQSEEDIVEGKPRISNPHEQSLIMLDTAGIRRKSKVHELVEATSVLRAIRAIERAEVVVLMCDAIEGVAEQDAKIAGLAVERGRSLIIALNKCDELDAKAQKKAEENALDKLTFAPWAPVLKISAKTGRGVSRLVETIINVRENWSKRLSTGEMNRFFEGVLETHPPPTMNGKFVRLYYITQAEVRPPTFVVVTNQPSFVHFSYQRYIANQIRKRFGFDGTPINMVYRQKRKVTLDS